MKFEETNLSITICCLASVLLLVPAGEALPQSSGDGRDIQRAILETSAWNRPNSKLKYLNRDLEQSITEVRSFTWENRKYTHTTSQPMAKTGSSSRRHIPTHARDELDEQNGRRARKLIFNSLQSVWTSDNESGRKAYQLSALRRGISPDNVQLGRKARELVNNEQFYKRIPKQNRGSCYRSTFCSRDR